MKKRVQVKLDTWSSQYRRSLVVYTGCKCWPRLVLSEQLNCPRSTSLLACECFLFPLAAPPPGVVVSPALIGDNFRRVILLMRRRLRRRSLPKTDRDAFSRPYVHSTYVVCIVSRLGKILAQALTISLQSSRRRLEKGFTGGSSGALPVILVVVVPRTESILDHAHRGTAGHVRRAQALARQLRVRHLHTLVVRRYAAAATVVGFGLLAWKEEWEQDDARSRYLCTKIKLRSRIVFCIHQSIIKEPLL